MKPSSHNLVFLGLGSILIAIITVSVSLIIYHGSGDIYLDRSRPGFMPDKTEADEEESTTSGDYTFSDTGTIDSDALDDYLKALNQAMSSVTNLNNPYSSAPLSDESLGISDAKNSAQP